MSKRRTRGGDSDMVKDVTSGLSNLLSPACLFLVILVIACFIIIKNIPVRIHERPYTTVQAMHANQAIFTQAHNLKTTVIVRRFSSTDDSSVDVKVAELEPEQLVLATARNLKAAEIPIFTGDEDGTQYITYLTSDVHHMRSALPMDKSAKECSDWCKKNGYCIAISCEVLPIYGDLETETNQEVDRSLVGRENELVSPTL